jgi:hypothetical protein
MAVDSNLVMFEYDPRPLKMAIGEYQFPPAQSSYS